MRKPRAGAEHACVTVAKLIISRVLLGAAASVPSDFAIRFPEMATEKGEGEGEDLPIFAKRTRTSKTR